MKSARSVSRMTSGARRAALAGLRRRQQLVDEGLLRFGIRAEGVQLLELVHHQQDLPGCRAISRQDALHDLRQADLAFRQPLGQLAGLRQAIGLAQAGLQQRQQRACQGVEGLGAGTEQRELPAALACAAAAAARQRAPTTCPSRTSRRSPPSAPGGAPPAPAVDERLPPAVERRIRLAEGRQPAVRAGAHRPRQPCPFGRQGLQRLQGRETRPAGPRSATGRCAPGGGCP